MIKRSLLLVALTISSFFARAQWTLIDTITQANFINIHFWDAQKGIISGEMSGRFLKTNNGANTWDTVQVPFINFANDNLMDMQFVDANHGFACGGGGFSPTQNILIGTSDAGQTWDTLTVNAPNAVEFEGLDFKNKDTGIVFSYSSLFKTYNGGHTLIRMSRPDTNFSLQDIVLLPDNSIIVTGSLMISSNVQRIYRSTNWGASWSMVYTDNSIGILSLAMRNGLGIAGCSNGYILKTVNDGLNWTKTLIAADSFHFSKAKFGTAGEIYLLAIKGYDGYLFGSNDGANWQSLLVATNETLVDIAMPTKQTGYLITYRKIFKTTTGGGMTLSINETPEQADDILIYPNPANEQVNIRNNSSEIISGVVLYDVTGRLVTKLNGNIKTVNTAGLQKGMYMIEVNTLKNKITRKLVIE